MISTASAVALEIDRILYGRVESLYIDDFYEPDKWNRKKRLTLKRIILREAKKQGKKSLSKYKVWVEFWNRIKGIIAGQRWEGYLPEHKDWQRHNYLTCGQYGKMQEDIHFDKRYLVYNCNQRKLCPDCNKRYHKGRARKAEERSAAVIRANHLERLEKFRLTFPDFIRDQIKTDDHRKAFKSLANEFLQWLYGCTIDKHGRYERGSVGVGVEFHARSTRECWKDSSHIHAYVIPVILCEGEKDPWNRLFDENDFEQMRVKWSKLIKRLSADLGFERVNEIPDEVGVNYRYGYLPELVKQGEGFGFNLGYDMRSPAHDMSKAISAINMEDETVIVSFKRDHLGYFETWSFEYYADRLFELLNLSRLTSTYGWLRRFERNASALGVEVKKEDDVFDPLDELEIRTEYRREYKWNSGEGTKKGKQVKILYMRLLEDANNPGLWVKLDSWRIHGEDIWTGSKKRYIYSVANNKSPPDRGG